MPFPFYNWVYLSLFVPLPRDVDIEQLCWASDLFCSRFNFLLGGWQGSQGSCFVFHAALIKQTPTCLLLEYVSVSGPALWVMSVGTHTVVLLGGSSVGQDKGSHDGLGYVLPNTADFMFLLLKRSFPNWSSDSSHWSGFIIWSSARPFSLGNGVLHQKNLLSQKCQTIPRSPFWDLK